MKFKFSNNTTVLIKNIVNSLLVKGGSLFIALFTTPAYMRYYDNNSVLGVWFTILAILSWILNFDMGIGNGLRNALVVQFEKNNIEEGKKYISSAYIFLGTFSGILGIVLVFVCKWVNWNTVLNISPQYIERGVLLTTVRIVLLSILLQFILRLISSIMYALQMAFFPNLLSLCTNVIMLVYVLLCNHLGRNNSIIAMAIMYLFAVNVPLVFATVFVFATKLKKYKPQKKYFSLQYGIEMLKVGGAFLVLQLTSMAIGTSSVTYLIGLLVSQEAVVVYNLYYKIFSQIYFLFSIALVPIWSAVTKAITNENYMWVKKVVSLMRLGALAISAMQLVLPFIMQTVFDIWLGDQTIPVELAPQLAFMINNLVMMLYALTAQVCNGLNELKSQMKFMILAAVILVPLSIILAKVYQNFTSIVNAQTLALVPYCVYQSVWLNRYLKDKNKTAI